MRLDDLLATIPYLAPHALRASVDPADGSVRVEMPFRREIQNLVGGPHAGALFTTAETAAGAVAFGIVPGGAAFPHLRSASVRYTRRADGDVVASAGVEPGRASEARGAFEESRRADVCVEVRIASADGAIVFEGTFDYALRARKP